MKNDTKDLLSEITEYQGKSVRCAVGKAMAMLSEAEHDAVLTALADPRIEGTAIAKFLQVRGYRVPNATLQRHRRSECRCPKADNGS